MRFGNQEKYFSIVGDIKRNISGLLVISECSIYVPPEHTGGNFVFDLVDVNGIPTQNGTGVLVARDPTHDGVSSLTTYFILL